MRAGRQLGIRSLQWVSWAAFVLLGWSASLVPALIRSIEHDFGQNDAGLGGFFLAQTISFMAGSFAGGFLTEQVGRRRVLLGALSIQALGLIGQSLPFDWLVFVVGGVLRGIGNGAVEGTVQGLFLDAFPSGASRAMNVLHVFWSLGALISPVVAATLVTVGVPWQALMAASAVASVLVAIGYVRAEMPSGRHERAPGAPRIPLGLPLVAAGAAIAAYVAAEAGVASWIVRFLAAAPVAVASSALSLFWGGLTVGRLVAARYGDRLEPLTVAVAASLVAAGAIVGAVVAPSVPVSIALFTLAGIACGPIYPTIILIGGRLHPGRAAAVSGLLSGAAVGGAVAYPPLMGAISVSAGIGIAMLGTAALAGACAALLMVIRRSAGARDEAGSALA